MDCAQPDVEERSADYCTIKHQFIRPERVLRHDGIARLTTPCTNTPCCWAKQCNSIHATERRSWNSPWSWWHSQSCSMLHYLLSNSTTHPLHQLKPTVRKFSKSVQASRNHTNSEVVDSRNTWPTPTNIPHAQHVQGLRESSPTTTGRPRNAPQSVVFKNSPVFELDIPVKRCCWRSLRNGKNQWTKVTSLLSLFSTWIKHSTVSPPVVGEARSDRVWWHSLAVVLLVSRW